MIRLYDDLRGTIRWRIEARNKDGEEARLGDNNERNLWLFRWTNVR